MPWHIRQHRSSIVALWRLRTMAMFINPNKHFGPANSRETFVTPLLRISLYFLWSVFPRSSHSWSIATAIEWQRHLALRAHTHIQTHKRRETTMPWSKTKALFLKKSDTLSVGSPCPHSEWRGGWIPSCWKFLDPLHTQAWLKRSVHWPNT